MRVSAALINDLTEFSDVLDGATTYLPAACDMLAERFAAAIPAFLGLTAMVHIDHNPVLVSTMDPSRRAAARASLHLALLPLGASTTSDTVSFYGTRPGMFVKLANDARWIFNLDGRPVLDNPPPSCNDANAVRVVATQRRRTSRCRQILHLPGYHRMGHG